MSEPKLKYAFYGPAPAVTAIVHNNKIIAIGHRREMLKQMKQLRRETGDDRKRLHLANAPGRKVGDLWDTKPVPRASRRIQDAPIIVAETKVGK